MHLLGKCSSATIKIIWDKPLYGNSFELISQFRGAISNLFKDNDYFHQHNKNGKFIYRYPHIQYRWSKGHGLIVGWMDATQTLLSIPWLDLQLSFKQTKVNIVEISIQVMNSIFAISDRNMHYTLKTPLLLFNQNNFKLYQNMSFNQKIYEQDRLLKAQILTALRGINIEFNDRLYATFTSFKPVKCKYKGKTLMGIFGKIATNAFLPDDFAIGHAVSHGYGWLKILTFSD